MFYNYSKSNKNFFFDNHAITVSYKNPNPPPPPKKGGGGEGGGALTSNFAKTHFIYFMEANNRIYKTNNRLKISDKPEVKEHFIKQWRIFLR